MVGGALSVELSVLFVAIERGRMALRLAVRSLKYARQFSSSPQVSTQDLFYI